MSNKDEQIAELQEKLARAEGARDALLDVVKDRVPVFAPPWIKCWSCGVLYRGLHVCNLVPITFPPAQPYYPALVWGQMQNSATTQCYNIGGVSG